MLRMETETGAEHPFGTITEFHRDFAWNKARRNKRDAISGSHPFCFGKSSPSIINKIPKKGYGVIRIREEIMRKNTFLSTALVLFLSLCMNITAFASPKTAHEAVGLFQGGGTVTDV